MRSCAITLLSSRRSAIAGLILGLIVSGCSPTKTTTPTSVTVFAAASLTDALGEIATVYEAETGQRVRLSFGASGGVARQIQAGAPADAVVLADRVWMDRLEAEGTLSPGSRADLLRNHLVVIASDTAQTGPDPFTWLLANKGRFAIGDPDSVPAGDYARTWLQKTGQWQALQSRIVTAADVRAVRTFVERGEAELGVVYQSDTVGASGVKIVARPVGTDEPDILYPAAATVAGAERAAPFLAFLKGSKARRIFAAHGFDPAP